MAAFALLTAISMNVPVPWNVILSAPLNVYTFVSEGTLCVECVWNLMALAQKPDYVFREKRTSPFKSARGGASVQSTAGQPGVQHQR